MLEYLATKTLFKRIVTAMTVMTIIVGTAYCAAVWYGISLTEELLIGRTLEMTLSKVINPTEQTDQDKLVIYGDGVEAKKLGYAPIPERYRDEPMGFSEVLDQGDLFIFKKKVGDTVWLVERDQFGFENREIELYAQAFTGLLIAVILSVLVSLWLAKTITHPIQRLSQDVLRMVEEKHYRPLNVPLTDDEIGKLAAMLDATLKKLHEALDRERAFTADVSHELRTPLMVIASSCELLSISSNETARQRCVHKIQSASDRLSRLVRVFLELARGTTTAIDVDIRPINDTVRDVVDNWREVCEQKGIGIQYIDDTTKSHKVNASLVISLVDNLVRNAVQYTAVGTIEVRVSDTALSVADTGRGIVDAEKREVLEAFVRGKTAPGEGYGWGLSLVRRICEHLHWQLSFASRQPQGTVFTVKFQFPDEKDV